MKNGKTKKKGDNTVLYTVLGLLGVGGSIGVAVWARSRSSDSSSASSASSTTTNGKPKTLAEVAAAIRKDVLTVEGCSVAWKLGEPSRTSLLAHQSDFFVPGIADARSKGLSSVDEITGHLAGLLVPGCPWPPKLIQDFDITDAVAGQLPAIQNQMWTIAQAMGAVQLYLAIRQVVAPALLSNRRG